jgi:small subunit ribosomal protein S8
MDPIANMLTTLSNAQQVGKKRAAIPYSRFKKDLLDLLQNEGMVAKVRVQESPRAKLVVTLAYDEQGQPRFKGVRRLSTPGQRVYVKKGRIPYTYQGFGTVILSTSQGLMIDREARRQGLGGELLCAIW